MLWRRRTLHSVFWLALAIQCAASPAHAAGQRTCHHRCRIPFLLDPRGFDGVPLIPTEPRVYGLPPETEPTYEPQAVPSPSPSPSQGLAPYPQGFILDVPITGDHNEDQPAVGSPNLIRYRQVADALARCWRPPAAFDGRRWRQATLRVSFRRDGTVNGTPLIPYVDGDLTAQAQSDLKTSLLSALRDCSPLPFSSGLGNAVAGQIFALRFINQDHD